MSITLIKIKNNLKKAALLISLFLAVFFGSFFLVNFSMETIDEAPMSNKIAPVADLGSELKKRMGSTTFSVESYEEWANRYGLKNSEALGLDADPDGDKLPNYLEYVHGTNPLQADSDGDKYSDEQEIINGYDPDAPGDAKPSVSIIISKINVNAPMVWSLKEDEKSMLKDLENGVNHFPKTSAPGQIGNMVISGHSSNYVWAKGNYNHIFQDLNNLEKGDLVSVRTMQANGRVITYQYRVNDKFITSPDDERIFALTSEPTLTLSTCWPLGTNFKRIIVKAELVK